MKSNPLGISHARFGLYEFDKQTGELRKRGLKIRLGPQASSVLSLLLERPGEIRTREEIQKLLWSDNTFVDFERGLYRSVYELRKALGDLAVSPRYIETVASKGYRFIPIPQETEAGNSAGNSGSSSKRGALAVLPFECASSDSEIAALNETTVEHITDTLSSTPGIRVLAYSTVEHYRGKDLDLRTVARKLLVQMIITGKIVSSKDVLLVHVELIDAEDGAQLWGAHFRECYADVLSSPEKLTDRICALLLPSIPRGLQQQAQRRNGRR